MHAVSAEPGDGSFGISRCVDIMHELQTGF
jgi:hypothetical protein